MLRPRALILLVSGLIGLVLLALAGFVGPVREGLRSLLLPVARLAGSAGAGISRTFHLDVDAKTANERADELSARLNAITVDYVHLRALEEENASLRAQVHFIADSGFGSVGARVIARSVRNETAAVTIDRGARDGIEVGQAVVTDEGLLVGKIFTLGEHTATVLLISDTQSRVAAAVAGSDRLSGIVEGRGSGATRFTLVPQSVPLARDNVVVTAGTEDKVPANLVIGLVDSVDSQPTDPFKEAVIEPLAPLERLDLVSVIVPK